MSGQKKKKRKREASKTEEVHKPSDLQEKLRRLKDHMASELDIFPDFSGEVVEDSEPIVVPKTPKIVEEIAFEKPPMSEFKEVKPINKRLNQRHTFLQNLNFKQAILLKEILDKPRALKPITDDW